MEKTAKIKINNIYIGGWFQRTMLQLSEIYDFIRGFGSNLKQLNPKKIDFFLENLEIESVDYRVSGEEYIYFTTKAGITVKIFEDGLITLNKPDVTERTFLQEINKVQDFYENKLSPALNYLFSLGAPVPKELAGIKNVYPYFIICDKAKDEDIQDLLEKIEQQKYFEFKNNKYSVIRGDKYYFINNKSKSNSEIERYVEEEVFIREFKGQLHRYLNIHRIIWERIDDVKAHANVKGSEVIQFTTKLEAYAKTINLIDGRIRQMGTYVPTREKIAKEDSDLVEFLEISGYRYETLRDTLEYIQYLWDMTRKYVESAQKQFDSLKSDMANKSIDTLTVVSTMSAGACIITLLQSFTVDITPDGIISILGLAIVCAFAPKILNRISERQKYKITDIEYEKNIK